MTWVTRNPHCSTAMRKLRLSLPRVIGVARRLCRRSTGSVSVAESVASERALPAADSPHKSAEGMGGPSAPFLGLFEPRASCLSAIVTSDARGVLLKKVVRCDDNFSA